MQKKSINDLYEKIFQTIDNLNQGKIDPEEAKQVANLGQTMINGLKTQIEGARQFKEMGINLVPPEFMDLGKGDIKKLETKK